MNHFRQANAKGKLGGCFCGAVLLAIVVFGTVWLGLPHPYLNIGAVILFVVLIGAILMSLLGASVHRIELSRKALVPAALLYNLGILALALLIGVFGITGLLADAGFKETGEAT